MSATIFIDQLLIILHCTHLCCQRHKQNSNSNCYSILLKERSVSFGEYHSQLCSNQEKNLMKTLGQKMHKRTAKALMQVERR